MTARIADNSARYQGDASSRRRRALRTVGGALVGAGLLLLGGCQGANVGSESLADGESPAGRPVQLFAGQNAEAGSNASAPAVVTLDSLRRDIDEKSLALAVERHRINLKQQPSPYRSIGIDLNNDGLTEALVLLEGADWCANTGCTLAIFTASDLGFRPLATIRRVWAPVIVTEERNNGFNDLVVSTGLTGGREQRVRLRFGANGYPGNAITQTPMPADIEVGGTVVLEQLPQVPQDLASNAKP